MDNATLQEQSLFTRMPSEETAVVAHVSRSLPRAFLHELWTNKPALVAAVVLIVIVIAALAAPLCPFDPDAIDIAHKLEGPSAEHWFGTDDYGRDLFTRTLYGGRVSLTVGFCAMAVSLVIGTAIGVCAGYAGGKIDTVLMRLTDIFLALPSLLLMIVLNALLKPGLVTLILVLSLFSWASVARITRAETMSIKHRDFVVASENLGARGTNITLKHIVPNIASPLIVSATLGVAGAILTESSLSFLGLGVQIPQSSWGSMLQSAQAHILDAPLMAVYPGVLILVTVLCFNLIGDVVQATLQPGKQR